MVDGLHVPVMPLLDVAGNAGGTEFRHSGPMALNVGPTCDVTTTFMVVGVPHWFDAGVKV